MNKNVNRSIYYDSALVTYCIGAYIQYINYSFNCFDPTFRSANTYTTSTKNYKYILPEGFLSKFEEEDLEF